MVFASVALPTIRQAIRHKTIALFEALKNINSTKTNVDCRFKTLYYDVTPVRGSGTVTSSWPFLCFHL